MHEVSDRKQLFIDRRFIEASDGVTLKVNPPVKRPEPVLQSDKPWDAFRLIWYSVAEDEGRYKMWYQAFDDDQWAGGIPRLCYAESNDGLNWEKPNLGLMEYRGSRENNILLENSKMAFIFIDPQGKPEERYKMITVGDERLEFPQVSKTGMGARMGTSPDGLRWNIAPRNVSRIPWDTQKVAFWDPSIDRYVVYLKLVIKEENRPVYPFAAPVDSSPPVVSPNLIRPGRSIGRLEMEDIMQPWPEDRVQTVMAADEIDPPESDIYHHNAYRYPYAADAYFMFPFTYQHFGDSETDVSNDGLNDVQFAASRNGIHWMRYDRRPYIGRGLPGEPDCGQAGGSPFHIRRGSYLYHYRGGWPWTHGGFRRLSDEERQDGANWGRAAYYVSVQRLDGFVSADAGYERAWLVTPPLSFKGSRLELNIDAAAMGEARIELQDEKGKSLSGFSLEDSDRVLINDTAYTAKWRGRADVSSLAGKPVRMKIVMRSARLFAFQFRQ